MIGSVVVKAFWDEEARVWVATSDDVPGLITEAETCDALAKKLMALIPELLEANGLISADNIPEIPVHLYSECKLRTHRKAC